MRRGFTTPLVITIMMVSVVVLSLMVYWSWSTMSTVPTNQQTNQPATNTTPKIACPADAKQCPDGSYVGRTGPGCRFAECPATNANINSPLSSSNVFNFDTAKVGDTIGLMTISAIGLFNPEIKDIVDNKKVEFTGEVILTGKVTSNSYDGSSGPGQFCMNEFDSASEQLLPKILSDVRMSWFCFINNTTASTALSSNINKTTTVKIKNYKIQLYPSEVYNMAEFVSVVSDPTAGWKTYTNKTENFSMKYPQTFSDFALSNDTSIGFRGKTIGTATSAEGSISLFILEKKYDTATIEGLYGPVEKDRQNTIEVGSRPGVMFLSGDAGCGAQEVLTSLDTNRTLWISFQDCEDVTPHTPLYQQQDLVNDILKTFTFTN